MGEWERRNQALDILRKALRQNPANLELANRYWLSVSRDASKGEGDIRSGSHVIEAYREAAISSSEGVRAFARAYRELFENSGESPRSAYFDDCLITALKAGLSELSGTDRSNVEWILQSIGIVPRSI